MTPTEGLMAVPIIFGAAMLVPILVAFGISALCRSRHVSS